MGLGVRGEMGGADNLYDADEVNKALLAFLAT